MARTTAASPTGTWWSKTPRGGSNTALRGYQILELPTNSYHGVKLELQSDSNLVIKDSARRLVWASHTFNNQLKSGEWRPGWMLVSRNGQYRLEMQRDGNLVEKKIPSGQPVWATMTSGWDKYRLEMQPDGNLVEKNNASNLPVWDTHTGTRAGATLSLETRAAYLSSAVPISSGGGYKESNRETP